MKKILTILFLFIFGYTYAQEQYPTIINFDVNNKTINDEDKVVWIKEAYQFLMLNPQNAIDLKNYGNSKSEFNIIGSNANRILLEFYQPSKLTTKGRCAAGLEKGFLFLELDNNAIVIKSEFHLIESCLWSIEIISKKEENSEILKYVCENLQTSESFIISIDIENVTIAKEKHQH